MTDQTSKMMEGRIPQKWFRAQSFSSPMGEVIRGEPRPNPLGDGERAIGPFVLPPFQRPPVWTPEQKIRFIESCWMGLPIGAYVVNAAYDTPYDQWLLDGQQRITAIFDYVGDEFPVYGLFYSELTVPEKRQWTNGIVFTRLEVKHQNTAELREVYDRLAYGGTPHDPTDTD
jgi:hypothetical protein